MAEVFIKVAVIFAMIGAGFIAFKAGVLPKGSSKILSSLLVNVTVPCLAISSIASQELSAETSRMFNEVLIGSIIFFILACPVSHLIVKALRYEPESDRGVLECIITSANTGFMGFPISKALFGDRIFFLFIIQNIVLNAYIYSGAVVQIDQGNSGKISLKKMVKDMANPCMAATLFAVILLIAGISLPAPAMDFFKTMGDSTIPVSMIVVGIQLGEADLKALSRNYKLTFCCICSIVVMPLLTLAAVWFLPLTDPSKLTLVFAAAFPSAVLPVAIAEMEHRNSVLMSQGVAITTLMSLITLPVWAVILMGLYTY